VFLFSVSFQRKDPLQRTEEDNIYIQKLDRISSLHTTCEVSGPVTDKSESHLVMA